MRPEYDEQIATAFYKEISEKRMFPNYLIAENMEYLAREGDCGLSESELFNLSVKVQEAAYTSPEELLHFERLDAARYLLQFGIPENRFDFLPNLNPEQTKAFLLSADEYDVCTLVDMVASDNRDHYVADNAYSISKQEDGKRLLKALKQAASQKAPLTEQIKSASVRAETAAPGKSLEKDMEL